MTATIILVMYLFGAPDDCRDEPLPVAVSLSECAMMGPAIAQEYLADHPRWRLNGWRCRVGAPEKGA